MSFKKLGKRTYKLSCPPSIAGHANCVGDKEGQGPLKDSFDYISADPFFGEKSWEKAESSMVKKAYSMALDKAALSHSSIDMLFAGDLLNQCVGTTFGLRESGAAHFGVYGACSTMAESLALASMAVDGGFADTAAAVTCSHFCTAERQFRTPLEYGGQRTPTAQWTVTGAGAVVLKSFGPGPYVTHITPGMIVDPGIVDANNMGAAMAPAAYDTIKTHFEDTGRTPADYDLIVTGDLGKVGSNILVDFFKKDGVDISKQHTDCGLLIFDLKGQDVHAGGSGCGCSASVLTGYLLNGMREGRWKRILFAATGALMSTTTSQQGESIPGISCAVVIDTAQ